MPADQTPTQSSSAVVDLFAGAGGWSEGLRGLGYNELVAHGDIDRPVPAASYVKIEEDNDDCDLFNPERPCAVLRGVADV